MRELFDEDLGSSSLDPEESVRNPARAGHRNRFYTAASVRETPEGFAVLLDDRPVRTPSRNVLAAPAREIAETMAAEWEAQRGVINPMTMPLTRLANSIIDGVTGRVDVVIEDIAKYLKTDLLFYRAGHPDALVAREARQHIEDRVLFWAAEHLEARFILRPRASCMSLRTGLRRSQPRARRYRQTLGWLGRCMS